tara:strand:- start:1758 stop:2507 length:750 start_codon:yes stop_codon:yes gene_type:complete
MKNKQLLVDRSYKLKKEAAPLSYMLPTSHNKRISLLHFDDKTKSNRALRYSSNQKSVFIDEQDGNIILEPIVFEDGFLSVPSTNPVLQEFLYLHPHRDIVFEEVDDEKDAQEEVDFLNIAVEALTLAKNLTISQLEMVSRVLFGTDPAKLSTAELKRDVLVFARREPLLFINTLGDPQLNHTAKVKVFFEKNLLAFRNNQKDVYFNTKSNKKRMLVVPFGEDPYYVVSSYLQSEEGIESLKMLETNLED